jgi:glucose-1-phosphate thymidylyltransferase
MKIIIPMAGMGKRMRPHTLTVPKPLLPVAGKPIVHRLVEDIVKVCGSGVEEIAFVVGRFGEEAETRLIEIAEKVGAKGTIHYQDEPLGTAHAVWCAESALDGNVVVAFADTLFKADFTLDASRDGIIWVQKVPDPRQYGVVKLNSEGTITDFIEKPQQFVSDLAIIGIYYFKDGKKLKEEIKYLLDNNISVKGEFQLTDALENLKRKGTAFVPGQVSEWLDCGNKTETVKTNSRYLNYIKDQKLVADSAVIENSVIVHPVFIGENAKISNSVIGPNVSVGNNTEVADSVIKESIIQENSFIRNVVCANSMIGNNVRLEKNSSDYSVGDYNTLLL